MKLLTDKEWRGVYRDGNQNLFRDFYEPALSVAVQYDRAVGFFSSETLVSNLRGISNIVKNRGSLRLVIGDPLDQDEFEAVKNGYALREHSEKRLEDLLELLQPGCSGQRGPLPFLTYLIADKRLEIKFAFRKRGMYHEKIGVIKDSAGNKLTFHGSANETIYALDEGFNAESISVFRSWDVPTYNQYGLEYEEGFEELWRGEQTNTVVVGVPSEFYEFVAKKIPKKAANTQYPEEFDFDQYQKFFDKNPQNDHFTAPAAIDGRDFNIREHQRRALLHWREHNYQGILQHSTGSGKTITSLYGATRIYEAFRALNKPFLLVISAPTQPLADQWVSNLQLFGSTPIKCYESMEGWRTKLTDKLQDIQSQVLDFLSIVVVEKTLRSEAFQCLLSQIDEGNMMFIGDECHNLGSTNNSESLPNAKYRLGLSATPFRSDEDEIERPFPDDSKTQLIAYFGAVVDDYSIADAISDGVLTPYEYHLVLVSLTEEEQTRYEELTHEIGRLYAISETAGGGGNRTGLNSKLGERSRLLGGAENKLIQLKKIAQETLPVDRQRALFYCGEGRGMDDEEGAEVIERVSEILGEAKWKTMRITKDEKGARRRQILQSFADGAIDALVSKRVLDEGVDLPACRSAYILASTRNPRQYIQRRGRVLRRFPGKEMAKIFDFMVLPLNTSSASMSLMEAELDRVRDFSSAAKNHKELLGQIRDLETRVTP